MKKRARQEAIVALRPWVGLCAAFLHLDHWTILVETDRPQDGMLASVGRLAGQMDAFLTFSDAFFDLSERRQREVLAHELIHIHLRPIWETKRGLETLLGAPAWTMYDAHARLAEEQVVEALARVLAPLMPGREG